MFCIWDSQSNHQSMTPSLLHKETHENYKNARRFTMGRSSEKTIKWNICSAELNTFVHKFSKFSSDMLIKQETVTSGRWSSLSCTRYSPRAGSMTRPGPCHTSNMTLCDFSLQAIIIRHKTTLSNFKHSYIQSVTFVDLEDCFSR